VSSAVALANLDIFEREGLNAHVKETAPAFRATLEKLYDLPIVGDVRGEGFFYGIELVKDKTTKETFNDDESERLLRGFLSSALLEAGLYCRADDRGDPVVQLAPPLISGQAEFDEIEQKLRQVLSEAWSRL
jgi:adenosylmethionine-8-amino-7-oxononanoate aminotransferase